MQINLYQTLAGLIVGFVIGLTGMGGGALMTPVLVLIFGVTPAAAVSADVVTSLVLKPFGGAIHVRRRTVNWRLVQWLMVGSVPGAFLGAYLLDQVVGAENKTRSGRSWVGCSSSPRARSWPSSLLQAKRKDAPVTEMMDQRLVRPVPTLLVGAVGGLVVGMTSVGSGSLIIVMLMLMYPLLSSREMVGTDLVQAIPLVGAATLGHVIFGSIDLSIISSVLIGAIPAVMLGAHFSSRCGSLHPPRARRGAHDLGARPAGRDERLAARVHDRGGRDPRHRVRAHAPPRPAGRAARGGPTGDDAGARRDEYKLQAGQRVVAVTAAPVRL